MTLLPRRRLCSRDTRSRCAQAPREPGLTTEVAALVTVLLGGLVMFGWPALAVGLGITTSAVLAFKAPLHGLVETDR